MEAMDRERIGAVAAGLSLQLEPSVIARLAAYGALFLEWNGKINLGGRIGAGELVARHYLDAFAAARFVSAGETVVDVGSGGGLPVIPLALVSGRAHFELYEPTAKKVAFLRTAIRELGLATQVKVNQERVEEAFGSNFVGTFDVALSRATFPLARWVEIGGRLVRSGGKVIAFGTDAASDGCPAPTDELGYASNRRLLVFTRP